MLVRFHEVSKSFGSFDVLQNASFDIHAGQKVGLIGPNGSGKTTLLSLIQNPNSTDRGTITLGTGVRIGRLDQLPQFGTRSILEEALTAFSELEGAEIQLRQMEESMALKPDPALLARYSQVQHEYEFQGGYSYRARAQAALLGVGLSADRFGQPAHSLSGGEKNRLALVQLLLSEADLLLLDEPTNHLDIRAIEWLERFLRDTPVALLIASHDRLFLDRIVGRVLEIDAGTLHAYTGNYTAYVRQREERLKRQKREWERQQEWIAGTQDFVQRNIAGQKTKQAQSRRKALERITPIERPSTSPEPVQFQFQPTAKTGRDVIHARSLQVGYATRTILENIDIDVERGQRWAFLGPNGSGKTTLLRSLIGRLPPIGGHLARDEGLAMGYYDQTLEDLDRRNTVLEELRSLSSTATDGELRSFLAQFLFRGEGVFKRVEQLSGGERSKLMLAKIIYTCPPLLALDEPTNHLDIVSREALEPALAAYPGTMLFISHDRRLVQRIATHILYLADDQARVFDRFEALEEWLENDVSSVSPETAPARTALPKEKHRPRLSKNRRDQVENEARSLEKTIEEREMEVQEIERAFQDPPADMDWDHMNRRHSELKSKIEGLYRELSRQLDLLDPPN